MIPSPLQVDIHFFTKIELGVSDIDPEKAGEGVLHSFLECKRHKDAERKYMLKLALKQTPGKAEGTPLYTFEFEVVGLFTVHEDYQVEKGVERLVRVNGAAVLYGAIREMAATLSARGPYPPITLPTVTFLDEAQPEGSKAKIKPKTGKRPGGKGESTDK